MNEPLHCPEYYADLARLAEKEKRFADAADYWRSARAVSIGHNRRQRYEDNEERCKRASSWRLPWPRATSGITET